MINVGLGLRKLRRSPNQEHCHLIPLFTCDGPRASIIQKGFTAHIMCGAPAMCAACFLTFIRTFPMSPKWCFPLRVTTTASPQHVVWHVFTSPPPIKDRSRQWRIFIFLISVATASSSQYFRINGNGTHADSSRLEWNKSPRQHFHHILKHLWQLL